MPVIRAAQRLFWPFGKLLAARASKQQRAPVVDRGEVVKIRLTAFKRVNTVRIVIGDLGRQSISVESLALSTTGSVRVRLSGSMLKNYWLT
jgi:hypothetical protein